MYDPIYASIKDLPLMNDFMFGQVMSAPQVAKCFLEELLEIEIAEIECPDAQKVITNFFAGKDVRLDIFVRDSNGRIYNIEMQRNNEYNLGLRSRYYQASQDTKLLKTGKGYQNLPQSYIIFVCDFDPLPEHNRMIYRLRTYCELVDEYDDDRMMRIYLNARHDDKEQAEKYPAIAEF